MNTLTKAGMDYSLISGRCLFNSNVVRDLLKDRQGMKECIYLMGNVNSSVDNNNKTKENENGKILSALRQRALTGCPRACILTCNALQ